MCQSKVCRSKVLRFQVMFYILLQATVTFNVEIIFFFVSQFSVMITTCQMGLRQFVHILWLNCLYVIQEHTIKNLPVLGYFSRFSLYYKNLRWKWDVEVSVTSQFLILLITCKRLMSLFIHVRIINLVMWLPEQKLTFLRSRLKVRSKPDQGIPRKFSFLFSWYFTEPDPN